jgi:death-on-curing protein
MEPQFLALDEVLEIHAQQIELYGGSDGVRDPAALESAVATPMVTFGGQFLHSTIPSMAAAYLFHICQNHAFVDGNKRTGANAAITFLLINDRDLDFSEDELVDLVLSVASGMTSKSAVTEIFAGSCRPASNPLTG